MKEFFSILQQCMLFHGIEERELGGMLQCLGAQEKRFEKKQTIAAEGETARRIGVVLSGEVQIEQMDYYGNRSILTKLEPSDLFGETFACAGTEKLPVDVIAAEDCAVLFIECSRIMTPCTNACGFHHQMIYNMLQVVAKKNLILNQKIEIISRRTTREKLMAYLLLQAKQHGSESFTIPYDRQALADYLEVERSAMSAELSKLRKDGILECEKNRFRLLSPDDIEM